MFVGCMYEPKLLKKKLTEKHLLREAKLFAENTLIYPLFIRLDRGNGVAVGNGIEKDFFKWLDKRGWDVSKPPIGFRTGKADVWYLDIDVKSAIVKQNKKVAKIRGSGKNGEPPKYHVLIFGYRKTKTVKKGRVKVEVVGVFMIHSEHLNWVHSNEWDCHMRMSRIRQFKVK